MKSFLSLIIFTLSHSVFAVDINTASVEELAHELSGIGPVKAQRIVEYREKIGGFVSLEQLIEVYGIGPKTLERNRNKIEISAIPPMSHTQNPLPPATIASLDSATSHTTSPKTEIKDKIKTLTVPDTSPSRATIASNDLSPKFEKPPHRVHNILWDALIIIPLFIVILFIFAMGWLKSAKKDKPVPREHLLSTTFICSGCGKVSRFQNVCYEGHFSNQYIDDSLPPGWSCIPNWLGKFCDYCFDCSKKRHPDNLDISESEINK
ncbi:MAG TPA: helix-hairpin-helix domain-containing protein [Thioploca sp.]|nr:MAG: hypothetical protein DRR19_04720 [Gammaproteobacteria bacterium]HDN27735.1 helix-hairpin-helix domain-containing protein [Thioploca sp.]